MNPYKGGKVYGPYIRKDNRSHVIILFPSGTKFTVSYPKYLMEVKLGRFLTDNEEVHHKDNDVTNNSEDNLIILSKKVHKSLQTKDFPEVLICAYCGLPFIATITQIKNRKYKNYKTGPFCSRYCQGKINN